MVVSPVIVYDLFMISGDMQCGDGECSIIRKRNWKMELSSFLEEWEQDYSNLVKNLPLFNTENISKLSFSQKQEFIRVFYHIRGHFHDFLWLVGSLTNNKSLKKIVLDNIGEEFSLHGISHEKLYWMLAENFDVNMVDEIVDEISYKDWVKFFNKEHIKFICNESQESIIGAFSAYEKLDNIDYVNLLKIAKCMTTNRKALCFFETHVHVKHYEYILPELEKAWHSDQEKVIKGFTLIQSNQINMWNNLYNHVTCVE